MSSTNVTGNYFYLNMFLDSTNIASVTGGVPPLNNYSNLITMKRVGLFPALFNIVGETSTVYNVPAVCRIADFSIYSKVLSDTEITNCMNGLDI
jgi:hypothetical protein